MYICSIFAVYSEYSAVFLGYNWCTTGVYVLTTLECILDSILYMNNLLRISLMNNNQNDCKFAKKHRTHSYSIKEEKE